MNVGQGKRADWRIVWQMFYPCVVSDLIDGCVTVIGHQDGNIGRIISSFLAFAVICPFYLSRKICRSEKNDDPQENGKLEKSGISKRNGISEKNRILEKIGVSEIAWTDICKIVILAAAFSLLLNLLNLFILSLSGTVNMSPLFTGQRWQEYILMCIAAPLREELLFRGIIFERLRCVLPFFWAAAGSAAFFGLIHGNLLQGIYAFLMGLILAWLYEKKGRLLEPVIFHSTANLTSLLIQEVIYR